MAAVAVRDVHKRFGAVRALAGVSLADGVEESSVSVSTSTSSRACSARIERMSSE